MTVPNMMNLSGHESEINVRVVADTIRPDCATTFFKIWDDVGAYFDSPGRIITIVMRYPRWIHAEFMTHRDRARNAASSRAVSVKKSMENNKFRPLDIPSEQKGMQGGNELDIEVKEVVYRDINEMCRFVTGLCQRWVALGVHKSIINRYLEPFSYIEVVSTSTQWDHLLSLRDHPEAEPHFQALAHQIRVALNYSRPIQRQYHLPFLNEKELIDIQDGRLDHLTAMKVSASRAAAISYQRSDMTTEKELAICEKLITNRHSSPLEHAATCSDISVDYRSGPMKGWRTLRNILCQDV